MAPHRSAELVVELAGKGNAGILREGIARLQGSAAPIVENISMEFVSAGFGLRRHEAADGTTKFSGVIRGDGLDFAHRIKRGIDNDGAQYRFAIVGSVEQPADRAVVGAIRLDRYVALRVLSRRDAEAGALHTLGEKCEFAEIAIDVGQRGDLPRVQHLAHVGLLGLQRWRCRCHGDGLGAAAAGCIVRLTCCRPPAITLRLSTSSGAKP